MKGKSRLYDNLATARTGARSESRWTVFNWDGVETSGLLVESDDRVRVDFMGDGGEICTGLRCRTDDCKKNMDFTEITRRGRLKMGSATV